MHDSEKHFTTWVNGVCSCSNIAESTHADLKGAESRRDMQKELQERLAQRGLPKSGNKAELAERLHAALAEEREMVLQDQVEARNELQRQFQESVMNPTSRCALGKGHLACTSCVQSRSQCSHQTLCYADAPCRLPALSR